MLLAVIDERRAARTTPPPTQAAPAPRAPVRQTTQAASFAAGLAAATSRR